MCSQGISLNRISMLLLASGLFLSMAAQQPVRITGSSAPAVVTTVTGIVRDATPSGHTYPLYAKIAFTSASLPPFTIFTDPFSGIYSTSLVQNEMATATITPILPGYPAVQVSFTPTTNPYTINFPVVANLTTCRTPGYTNSKVFLETFDTATPPALPPGWTVAKIGSLTTGNWTTAADYSAQPWGIEPLSSRNMVVFNSYTAAADHAAMLYTTSSISLASLSTAAISFWMYHDSGASSAQDKVQASISTNGSTFYLIGSSFLRYSATPGWAFHQVDISSYAGPGKPSVYIGLVGTSAQGYDIHIDDIAIGSSTCLQSAGGLVAGFVRGFHGGQPIISALVANNARPSEQSYSVSRGEDSALRDGFYQLFSTVSGLQTFTASAIRHLWTQQSVELAEDGVTRLDLAPTSAFVAANPNRVALTLAVGGTATLPLVLSNTGTQPASVTIQPAAGLLTSGSSAPGRLFPYHEEPAEGPTVSRDEAPGETNPQVSVSGGLEPHGGAPRSDGVTTPFPGTAGYRYATASCDGETFYVLGGQYGSTSVDEVWMYNPASHSWAPKAPMPVAAANMRAACIDGKVYLVGGYGGGTWKNTFQIYDTKTNAWTSTTQPFTGGPMLAAYNGLLYSFGGASTAGPSSQARVYSPATGFWTDLAAMPTAASYSGIVVYRNLIFVMGGANTAAVQVYNPAGNTWNNSGPDLPGPRMDPTVGWYGDYIYLLNGGGNGSYWIPYLEGYYLNASAWPAGSWTSLGPTVARPKSAPASVCANNRLWSVGGTVVTAEEHITQYYDGGLMCNRTYAAVPWLTAAPAADSILAGWTRTITLGFSATSAPYNIPGVYHAALKVNADAPTVVQDIPVTMVVAQTSSYLSVSPQSATQPVYPNKYASYSFTFTNKTGATDSFTVYALGISSGWTGVISPASFTDIVHNGSASLSVKLYPPAGAHDGDEGVVTLGIKVHDNASRFVTLSAIATFQQYIVALPYLAK